MAGLDGKTIGASIFKGALDTYLKHLEAEQEQKARLAEAEQKHRLNVQRDAAREMFRAAAESKSGAAAMSAIDVYAQTGDLGQAMFVLRNTEGLDPNVAVDNLYEKAPPRVKSIYAEKYIQEVEAQGVVTRERKAALLREAYDEVVKEGTQEKNAATLEALDRLTSGLAKEVRDAAFAELDRTGDIATAFKVAQVRSSGVSGDVSSQVNKLSGGERRHYISYLARWRDLHPGRPVDERTRMEAIVYAIDQDSARKRYEARQEAFSDYVTKLDRPEEVAAARKAWEESGNLADVVSAVTTTRGQALNDPDGLMNLLAPEAKEAYIRAKAEAVSKKGAPLTPEEKMGVFLTATDVADADKAFEKVFPSLANNPQVQVEVATWRLALRNGTLSPTEAMGKLAQIVGRYETARRSKDILRLMSDLPESIRVVFAKNLEGQSNLDDAIIHTLSDYAGKVIPDAEKSRVIDLLLLQYDIPSSDYERVKSILMGEDEITDALVRDLIGSRYKRVSAEGVVEDVSDATTLMSAIFGSQFMQDEATAPMRAKMLDPSSPNSIIGLTIPAAINTMRRVAGSFMNLETTGFTSSHRFEEYVNNRFATTGVPIDPTEVAAAWSRLLDESNSTDHPGVVTPDMVQRYAEQVWTSPDGTIAPPVDLSKNIDWTQKMEEVRALGFVTDPTEVPTWVAEEIQQNPRKPLADVLENGAAQRAMKSLANVPTYREAMEFLHNTMGGIVPEKADLSPVLPSGTRTYDAFRGVSVPKLLEAYDATSTGSVQSERNREQMMRAIQEILANRPKRDGGYITATGGKYDGVPSILTPAEAVEVLARFGHRAPGMNPGEILWIIQHSLPPRDDWAWDATGRSAKKNTGSVRRERRFGP